MKTTTDDLLDVYREIVLPAFRAWIRTLGTEVRRGEVFPLLRARDHGADHTARVSVLAVVLAAKTGSEDAVENALLAGLFHDCGRKLEFGDPSHGERGAEAFERLAGPKLSRLEAGRRREISDAVRVHSFDGTFPFASGTDEALLNADRLDLVRFGWKPDPSRLFGDAWKDLVEAAKGLAVALPRERVLADLGITADARGECA